MQIDLTPPSLDITVMVGDSWKQSFYLKDADDTPIILTGVSLFADILKNNVVISQLNLTNGITVAEDGYTFTVRKDWRTKQTQNGIPVLVPAVTDLELGTYKLIVRYEKTGEDVTLFVLNYKVVNTEISTEQKEINQAIISIEFVNGKVISYDSSYIGTALIESAVNTATQKAQEAAASALEAVEAKDEAVGVKNLTVAAKDITVAAKDITVAAKTAAEQAATTSGQNASDASASADTATTQAEIAVDSAEQSLSILENIGNIVDGRLQVVSAKASVTMPFGTPVYVIPADNSSSNALVAPASASSEATSSKTLGFTIQPLNANGLGDVCTHGELVGFNTSTATQGDPVYLGATAGTYVFGLANKPVPPLHAVYLGVVTHVHASQGKILVNVQNGFEMNEIHDYLEVNKQDGDVLQYEASSGMYKNKQTLIDALQANNSLSISIGKNLNGSSWFLGGFHNGNGYNIDSFSYKARTNYLPILAGTYYIRCKTGYRFGVVEQVIGDIGSPADAGLTGGNYVTSQNIVVTRPFIRIQIAKFDTNGNIDTTATFNVTDITEILQIVQIYKKKDRLSEIEDNVASQYNVGTERLGNGAVTSEKIASSSVSDDKLVNSFIAKRESVQTIAGLTDISKVKGAIKLLSASNTTATLVGKNFYDTTFVSGSGSTLVTQGINTAQLSISAGTYKTGVFANKTLPVGTFTASVEVEVLTGSIVQQYLYLYRTGVAGSTAVALTLDSTTGKYKGKITFTNTAEYVTRLEVQFSLGTATPAFTCNVTTQIELGSANTAIVPYIGQVLSLVSNVAQKVTNAGFLYVFGSGYNLYYYDSVIVNDTTTVLCSGDSLTEGAGSSTNKPSSDTNTDTSYPAVLGRLLPSFNVINNGVGGETSWKIAARHGGIPVKILPVIIPATATTKRVFLKGSEQDMYYNGTNWTYSANNLEYDIDLKGINPCKISSIEGNLSRTLLTSGTTDPDTGEVLTANRYAYYFTRTTSGSETTLLTPKDLITATSENYRNAIQVIWMGQNDAPLKNGSYVLQVGSQERAKRMVEHCQLNDKRYIVLNAPSGSDASNATIDQQYQLLFGKNFINIRKFICENGVSIANSLGANITLDSSDLALVAQGSIPLALRIDGVHGNYWYYQVVAKAIQEKGKDLGYW